MWVSKAISLKVAILFMYNINSSANGFSFKAAKIIVVAYLLLAYPLAVILPYELTWENGPIENLQVVVLLAACLVNARSYFRMKSLWYKREKMHLWQAVFFAMLAGRELSWGRVFVPTGMTEDGPLFMVYTPMQHTILHGVLGVVFLWLVVQLVRWVPWSKVVKFDYDIPWLFICVLFLSTFMVVSGERTYFGIPHSTGQALEELAELDMYFCLCCLSAWYNKTFCSK